VSFISHVPKLQVPNFHVPNLQVPNFHVPNLQVPNFHVHKILSEPIATVNLFRFVFNSLKLEQFSEESSKREKNMREIRSKFDYNFRLQKCTKNRGEFGRSVGEKAQKVEKRGKSH
jgi:hypothetical protein